MQPVIERFRADESGATAIEYALIGVLVAVAILVGATSLGGALNAQFMNIATSVNSAIAP
ncbi:Flp family type IVb pilin [bacterium M00.F.Ca.ET.159.01.1.1]|nr:Flp family type IVb pilin [bacterium M00.F.Ca.ET.159.01.1.1]TGT82471.1 Flp family type IVb pilin [bacterium M00.F.Ca.ET.157.01.1.1]